MKFAEFAQALRNIPNTSVVWTGMPGFPIAYEPIRIYNDVNDETILHMKITMDTNEIIQVYGIQDDGKTTEAIPFNDDPKYIDLSLKEILVQYANAQGDGGELHLDDVVM